MKRILLSIAVGLLLTINTKALDFGTNILAAGAHCLNTNPVHITSITLYSVGSDSTVGFFNNDVSGSTYTNASYIIWDGYLTNLATIFTNTWSITYTNTNSVWWGYARTIAASTNNLVPAGVFVCPAGTMMTRTVNWLLNSGVTVTNSATNVTVGFTYTY